jgi:hypothetical protein
MGEAFDEGGRDDRRVGSVAPHLLERRVAGCEVLAPTTRTFHFTTCSGSGTCGCKGRAKVAQDLPGLCGEITDADDVPLGIDRVLTTDVDRADVARNHRDVAERRVPRQTFRVEELHTTVLGPRGSLRHDSVSFLIDAFVAVPLSSTRERRMNAVESRAPLGHRGVSLSR